jgi:outer membrane receptor protein involved in Fe transport
MSTIIPARTLSLSPSRWRTFGDTSYKLLDALEVGAGMRYFSDSESSVNSYPPNHTPSFSSTDPRVYGRYQLTPDINTYVSAAKGFRPGRGGLTVCPRRYAKWFRFGRLQPIGRRHAQW